MRKVSEEAVWRQVLEFIPTIATETDKRYEWDLTTSNFKQFTDLSFNVQKLWFLLIQRKATGTAQILKN